uniref:Uncharacterized protein n=1 Tax=Pseudomonas phage Nican01 TaxID=3138540 RepID=A0AAU6W0S5_9CAUD
MTIATVVVGIYALSFLWNICFPCKQVRDR